ncbi:HAD family hydrolase [Nocardia sp. SYP-A9097]|uniref:HAD family hydrolase n=1 Tax=Nocardia sp. SYP-A9097 TaxID=2663237 RepID=UPI0018914569|nr:HAD hydrolase-like protein [Nocardia sp. SYP-A9097]
MGDLLVLWDIDHTLIENYGVNKEIYGWAFELLTGTRAEHRARTEGRTEPEIMRNMLIEHGIQPAADYSDRVLSVLESATLSRIEKMREQGHELPGAREALTALRSTPGIIQSVLSGNIKPNAITKLSAFTLNGFIDFEVGGYGSDDHVRDNLVAIAQRRASEKYGDTFDKANTVLIGDTSRDVQAGRNGGAHVIAVASGAESPEELRTAGADLTLPDLRDTQAVIAAVTSFQQARGSLL